MNTGECLGGRPQTTPADLQQLHGAHLKAPQNAQDGPSENCHSTRDSYPAPCALKAANFVKIMQERLGIGAQYV